MALTAYSEGVVAPGFEAVRDAFERNFAERGELGAAFAATHRGRPVADLWGGMADRSAGRPWASDTLQTIFSGTKGLVAICLLLLIDRGQLELEVPVARYWPEFAAAGKQSVTVRALATHTARLPGVAAEVSVEQAADAAEMARLLAAQPQSDDPRAASVYHPLTYGWLCGELVRRVDGRSVGRFFAEEVAGPLGLDLFIGLPAGMEERVARLELAESWGAPGGVFDPLRAAADPLVHATWANPPVWTRAAFPWNDARYRAAEIAGAGAIGSARSIAALYGGLDRLLSPAALVLGRTALERRREPLLDAPQAFGVGFVLQTETRELGPPSDVFGHGGAGGSVHGAWPAHQVGFSYAMNLMRDDQPAEGDPRAQALLQALYECARIRSQGG